jgi:hypothetical protein
VSGGKTDHFALGNKNNHQRRNQNYNDRPFMQRCSSMMRRFLQWFFRNRETGAITIAQAPNLVLWIVIVGSALLWVWHPPGRPGIALEIIVKGGLFVWAVDEVFRGINPWRRCLGVAVLGYELTAMLLLPNEMPIGG